MYVEDSLLCSCTWSLLAVTVLLPTKLHMLPWWRHQMETFSALLAICAGNSPVSGEFPAQRPVTRSFDVYFDLGLNKRLSKQSWDWWFETLLFPLWRHSNGHELFGLSMISSNPFHPLSDDSVITASISLQNAVRSASANKISFYKNHIVRLFQFMSGNAKNLEYSQSINCKKCTKFIFEQ